MHTAMSRMPIGHPRSRTRDELEWEIRLFESIRLTPANRGRHLLDRSGLEVHGREIDEIAGLVLDELVRAASPSLAGLEETAAALVRHSTQYAFLALLSRSDPDGTIRERLSQGRIRHSVWSRAVPAALDGPSRSWLVSYVFWLVACWLADEVIDANLHVDARVYGVTAYALFESWSMARTPGATCRVGARAGSALQALWRGQGVAERFTRLLCASMTAFRLCHEHLVRAGFSREDANIVRDWTIGYVRSIPQVQEALRALGQGRCSFEAFAETRCFDTAIDLPVLYLLLWHGRTCEIAPARVRGLAERLHPLRGDYQRWLRSAMIISGIGNDLVDVRRDLRGKSMNTVLCVYGATSGSDPFAASRVQEERMRAACREVAHRLNRMVEAMARDFRREVAQVERGQSPTFRTREELLATVTALVDTCFATVYAGFVCDRYREGAMDLVDALSPRISPC